MLDIQNNPENKRKLTPTLLVKVEKLARRVYRKDIFLEPYKAFELLENIFDKSGTIATNSGNFENNFELKNSGGIFIAFSEAIRETKLMYSNPLYSDKDVFEKILRLFIPNDKPLDNVFAEIDKETRRVQDLIFNIDEKSNKNLATTFYNNSDLFAKTAIVMLAGNVYNAISEKGTISVNKLFKYIDDLQVKIAIFEKDGLTAQISVFSKDTRDILMNGAKEILSKAIIEHIKTTRDNSR